MSEVVGAELDLVPIRRQSGRQGHDPRVEDQDVQSGDLGEDLSGAGLDGRERGEIELDECYGDIWGCGADVSDHEGGAGWGSAGEDDLGRGVSGKEEDGLGAYSCGT